jgi:hypothetical protein
MQLAARYNWHEIVKLKMGMKEKDIDPQLKEAIVRLEERYLNYII